MSGVINSRKHLKALSDKHINLFRLKFKMVACSYRNTRIGREKKKTYLGLLSFVLSFWYVGLWQHLQSPMDHPFSIASSSLRDLYDVSSRKHIYLHMPNLGLLPCTYSKGHITGVSGLIGNAYTRKESNFPQKGKLILHQNICSQTTEQYS